MTIWLLNNALTKNWRWFDAQRAQKSTTQINENPRPSRIDEIHKRTMTEYQNRRMKNNNNNNAHQSKVSG